MNAVTSPLKVRERKRRIWAEDTSKNVILDGKSGREVSPDSYVCAGPGGTWRVAAHVEGPGGKYTPLLDPTGREAARLHYVRRRGWSLELPSGETAEASSGGNLFKAFHCELGEFSRAKAPYVAPQRYFTLTLTDAALNHPSRDAIAVAAVWISEQAIAAKITADLPAFG